jgi:hypothetical protein
MVFPLTEDLVGRLAFCAYTDKSQTSVAVNWAAGLPFGKEGCALAHEM